MNLLAIAEVCRLPQGLTYCICAARGLQQQIAALGLIQQQQQHNNHQLEPFPHRQTSAALQQHWNHSASSLLHQMPRRSFSTHLNNSSDTHADDSTASTSAPVAAATADSGEEGPRRRRRTTESRKALRRTTTSRAAIEDVAVMSKSQLTRRNKPWLQEQCWERQLPHDGLKDELVQRLLDWQKTQAGQAAVAEATAAHAAAAAALGSSMRSNGQGSAAAMTVAAAAAAAAAAEQSVARIDNKAAAAAAAAAAARAEMQQLQQQAVRAQYPATSSMAASSSGSSSSSAFLPPEESVGAQSIAVQEPPRNAAEAAADTLWAPLQQLQQQPSNPALLAIARNTLELYVQQQQQQQQHALSGSSGAAEAEAAATALCQQVLANSSPQSLAALAKACYSREVQQPVLAAAMAAAVAAVNKQLGPQQVYGVLRLLAEHLGPQGLQGGRDSGELAKAVQRGFGVLAEAMIRCCQSLTHLQLAEAVQLLHQHDYGDPWGLWLISKEAARRLRQSSADFSAADVVTVVHAVAGMRVADAALCDDVAAAVAEKWSEFSAEQLQQIQADLVAMGHSGHSC